MSSSACCHQSDVLPGRIVAWWLPVADGAPPAAGAWRGVALAAWCSTDACGCSWTAAAPLTLNIATPSCRMHGEKEAILYCLVEVHAQQLTLPCLPACLPPALLLSGCRMHDEKETSVYKRAMEVSYQLKMKASRELLSEVGKKSPTMLFRCAPARARAPGATSGPGGEGRGGS